MIAFEDGYLVNHSLHALAAIACIALCVGASVGFLVMPFQTAL